MRNAFHPWLPLPHTWDDLRFPASGINPPGVASDPTRSATTGLLHFSGTIDNVLAGVAQMPHQWLEGTPVYPHIHLRFTTAAAGVNTRWLFEYDVASRNGDFANAYGTYSSLATITVANQNNALKNHRADFGALSMTGHTTSAIIAWRLSRLAFSDAADDDTNDCVLLEFDIHYLRKGMGSAEI